MASERESAPVKRQAHQSVEAMAAQMMEKKANRSSKSRMYNEVSNELKAQALDTAIAQQQALLKKAEQQGKIDLDNIDEVRKATEDYFTSCRIAGVYPSVTGLAPSMGISRQALNEYIRRHSSETAHYLDAVRSSMAAIVEQAGLTRQASEAVSIFLLKNNVDMADKVDVTAAAVAAEREPEFSIEQFERMYFEGSDEEFAAYKRGERPYMWDDENDPEFEHHRPKQRTKIISNEHPEGYYV